MPFGFRPRPRVEPAAPTVQSDCEAGRDEVTANPPQRAEATVARGDLIDAIEALTEANLSHPDPAIEERLIQLRLEAFSAIERTTGPASWPPAAPDLFPDVVGPPEVARQHLTSEVLRSAIFHHGCLLVRGLVDRSRVDHLVDDIDRAFAGYDAYARGKAVKKTAPWFVPFKPYPDDEREWGREGGSVLAIDSPRGLFDTIETFAQLGLDELATGFFGERPALLAKKWTFRRILATDPEADWHQDGAFMGKDIRSLDVWVSLSHCGRDAPGLDFVARRLEDVLDTGTDGARMCWTVGPGMVDRVAKGDLVQPVFEPGDALLFDHLLLHRTGTRPGMTGDRYAIEAWFASPSSYPAEQIPVAY